MGNFEVRQAFFLHKVRLLLSDKNLEFLHSPYDFYIREFLSQTYLPSIRLNNSIQFLFSPQENGSWKSNFIYYLFAIALAMFSVYVISKLYLCATRPKVGSTLWGFNLLFSRNWFSKIKLLLHHVEVNLLCCISEIIKCKEYLEKTKTKQEIQLCMWNLISSIY